jgi:hypothetical protein
VHKGAYLSLYEGANLSAHKGEGTYPFMCKDSSPFVCQGTYLPWVAALSAKDTQPPTLPGCAKPLPSLMRCQAYSTAGVAVRVVHLTSLPGCPRVHPMRQLWASPLYLDTLQLQKSSNSGWHPTIVIHK